MIQTHGLTKRFDDFVALDDISCTIPQGCIYGMVGSNGAGKSTFLRVLSGIYRADSGSVTFDDEPIYENPHNARFEQLTKLFGLNPQKNLNTFSKGMKRQAATILALSAHPQYIFFDETFDGLDPVMRHTVKNLICEEVLEHNATAIITSHSLRELEDTCDQLALLHKGGLVLESDIQNLKTSLFKVQIAFSHEFGEADFGMLEVLNFVKRGSVANLIVRGNRDETVAKLSELSPILLDVLPLSLEEVFTYEMEALGYTAGGMLEV